MRDPLRGFLAGNNNNTVFVSAFLHFMDFNIKHWSNFQKQHGAPEYEERHVGDLGNIRTNANGAVKVNITDSIVKLSGEYSVIGRAIVIHEGKDDLLPATSTGNAGKRLTCCKINEIKIDSMNFSPGVQISFGSILLTMAFWFVLVDP